MATKVASLYTEIDADISGLKRGLQQAEGEIKRTGGNLKQLAGTVGDLTKHFGTFAAGATLAFKTISEGAQLNLARDRFDNLAESIGTTSDALLGKFSQATGGMISNAEMIAGASQIISLGLADSEEGVVRLSTAVATLGLDMQQVILTFANNSKARLDALGLSVEDVTKKAEALEAQGFVGDAFDEAVLIALEEKMTLLGSATETTAGALQRMAVHLRNVKEQGLSIVAERSEGALLGMANLWDQNAANVKLMDDALAHNLITQSEHNTMMRGGAILLASQYKDELAALRGELHGINEMNARFVEGYKILAGITSSLDLSGLTLMGQDTQEMFNRQDAGSRATAKSLKEYEGAIRNAGKAGETFGDNAARVTEELQAQERAFAAAFQAAVAATDDIIEYSEVTRVSGGLTREQRENLSELRKEYDRVQDTIRSYSGGLKGVGVTEEERAKALEGLTARSAELQAAMSGILPAVAATSQTVAGSVVNYDAMNQALYDSVAAAGASGAELALLGVSLGVISEEAATAALKVALIEEGFAELAKGALEDGVLTRQEMTDIAIKARTMVDDINEMMPLELTADASDALGTIAEVNGAIASIPNYVQTVVEIVQSGGVTMPGFSPGMPMPIDTPIGAPTSGGGQPSTPVGGGSGGGGQPSTPVGSPTVNINVFGPSQSTPEAIAAKVGRVLAPRG